MTPEVRAAWLSKLSKSASDWLVIEEHASITACAEALRADGYDTLVATSPLTEGAVPLYGGDGEWARRRVAIMLGSEGSGLSDAAMGLADLKVSVPQVGMTQSLNVAACAAIVLSEALRLRNLPRGGVPAAEGDALGQGAPRLSEVEQQALEARLMPALTPPRLHNKAQTKAAMQVAKFSDASIE